MQLLMNHSGNELNTVLCTLQFLIVCIPPLYSACVCVPLLCACIYVLASAVGNLISSGLVADTLWHRCFIPLQYPKRNVSDNLIMQVICFVLPNCSGQEASSVKVMKTWQVPTAYMLICPSFAPGTSGWTPPWLRMINTHINWKWFNILLEPLIHSFLKLGPCTLMLSCMTVTEGSASSQPFPPTNINSQPWAVDCLIRQKKKKWKCI